MGIKPWTSPGMGFHFGTPSTLWATPHWRSQFSLISFPSGSNFWPGGEMGMWILWWFYIPFHLNLLCSSRWCLAPRGVQNVLQLVKWRYLTWVTILTVLASKYWLQSTSKNHTCEFLFRISFLLKVHQKDESFSVSLCPIVVHIQVKHVSCSDNIILLFRILLFLRSLPDFINARVIHTSQINLIYCHPFLRGLEWHMLSIYKFGSVARPIWSWIGKIEITLDSRIKLLVVV